MSRPGSKLVQYVVVRGDLSKTLQWPAGAIIAQACHACTAVIWQYKDDENTKAYTKEIDHMHEVVLEVSECVCMDVRLTDVTGEGWSSGSKCHRRSLESL